MKKTVSILMAVIMAMFSFPMAAFAAEEPAADAAVVEEADLPEGAEVLEVIDIDVTPDMVDENGLIDVTDAIKSVTLVDQTWTWTNYHQGSNRSYNYSTIGFKAKISDSNGNAVGDTISVELHDTTNGATQYFTVYADNNWAYNNNISIVSGRQYYFYYDNLSSSTRSMKIRMVIYH